MAGDPRFGLFKYRLELPYDVRGNDQLDAARQLQAKGLLDIREHTFVRCVNSLDRDQAYLRDRSCTGRIWLDPQLVEEDHNYRCLECDRVVFPSTKRRERALMLYPHTERMRYWLGEHIKDVEPNSTERPEGLWTVSGPRRQLRVCLVDVCQEPSVFALEFARTTAVLYVLGNDRDFAMRLPQDVQTYRLADLVLDSVEPFKSKLRSLLEQGSSAPAVFAPVTFSQPLSQVPVVEKARASLAVGSGVGWDDIALLQLDGTTIDIRVSARSLGRYSNEALGMLDRRSLRPTKNWVALMSICEGAGVVEWSALGTSYDVARKRVSELSRALQELFGLQTPPLSISFDGGVRAKFRTSLRSDGIELPLYE